MLTGMQSQVRIVLLCLTTVWTHEILYLLGGHAHRNAEPSKNCSIVLTNCLDSLTLIVMVSENNIEQAQNTEFA